METVADDLQTTGMNESFDSRSIGRLLYALPFVAFGVMHFLQGGALLSTSE